MKNIFEELKEIKEEFKTQVIEFAQKLIQTPSISGTEKEIADIYLSEMEKLGYDEVFRDDMGNVVGIINGTEEGPAIMYNSHMDHVSPGDVNNWEGYDPYGGKIDICLVDNQDKTVKELAECIHGRAASDVKGGAAAQIYAGAALVKLREKGFKFKGRFIFTGVVQEEPAEMVGMLHLVDKTFKEKGITYDAMVSSEASSLKLYCGHRGRVEFLATVYGRTSHGSAPWLGINAIYKSIPLINKIKDELYPSLQKDNELGQASISLNIIECSPGALSIVPDKCMLSIDRRTIPGENAEIAKEQIEKIIKELSEKDPEFKADIKVKSALEKSYTGIEYKVPKDMAPWKIGVEHSFVKAAAEALETVGQPVKYGYWDFGTDASKTAGIDRKPSIGYSPMQEQYAHTPYDKVRTDYIVKAVEGNAAIFLKVVEGNDKTFELLEW
ncbi:succinyl-diaminopimelate desuccinylase [Clostridium homopropionicum DSM 5847]|uniref:Succinyl-diaminopimelate desuccinylase n=1 Tax=Clostridium homopropionicum DSM 5847 TaxID=1121318 RepID=A0A0L6ZAU0_9CLOT|nr:M20/M25/M40 family metallo-hydrolase [Clostridium homopropionicum]KOA20091.1 succinyl-diaminopimelate desuccinylase [Clostridium homopropionicum DSM 5847]SFG86435.1 putative selenium metabolism hydrolase [Clostridium homopropionicum]